MDDQLAADRLMAAQTARGLLRLHDEQYHRFTRAERRALMLAKASLDNFMERTIEEA